MAVKILGETVDFHGGGEDLIFPHHENELAQSECATGKEFVRSWMHNGLLNLRGQKMSKSTGHFFGMEDVLKEFRGEVVRFYLLSTHFRSQMEYSRERLENAAKALERLENACRSLDERIGRLGSGPSVSTAAGRTLVEAAREAKVQFLAAMDDDFNSAGAIGYLFELIKTYNVLADEDTAGVAQSREGLEAVWATISEFDKVLGLFKNGLPKAQVDVPEQIEALRLERDKAKKEKNFPRADEIRKQINDLGFTIVDTHSGSMIRKL
jgi:cysteinyl-tRNA synthetase